MGIPCQLSRHPSDLVYHVRGDRFTQRRAVIAAHHVLWPIKFCLHFEFMSCLCRSLEIFEDVNYIFSRWVFAFTVLDSLCRFLCSNPFV